MQTGEEFIILGSNNGRIHQVLVQGGGTQFVVDELFKPLDQPILALTSDAKTKVTLVATAKGDIMFYMPQVEDDWVQVDS